MDAVLKKVGVQVLVEPVGVIDLRLLPDDLVSEGDPRAFLEFYSRLRGQVHIDDLHLISCVDIVAYLKLFVSPQVQVLSGVFHLADDTPNGEVVEVHLVPIVVADGILERLQFIIGEDHLTKLCLCHVG